MENKTQQINRQTAYIVNADEIRNSTYTKSPGEWDPNYLTIRGRQVGRVNLMGVVISVSNDTPVSFTLDDGTGNINVRIFDTNDFPFMPEVGDMVMVIGKPREYNEENYVVPEIIKEIKDETWMEVRKKQLGKLDAGKDTQPPEPNKKEKPNSQPGTQKTADAPSAIPEQTMNSATVEESIVDEASKEEAVKEETHGPEEPSSDTETIYNLIKELDTGEGTDVEEIMEKSGIDGAEKIINTLLAEGEAFEIRPGRIKALE